MTFEVRTPHDYLCRSNASGRHVTGLERITLELFSPDALAPLDVVPVTARGTRQMVMTQTIGLPMRLARSSAVLLCPGFPPSPLLRPFAARVLPYIHDIFLLSRRSDLSRRAKLYMAELSNLRCGVIRDFSLIQSIQAASWPLTAVPTPKLLSIGLPSAMSSICDRPNAPSERSEIGIAARGPGHGGAAQEFSRSRKDRCGLARAWLSRRDA